MKNFKFRAVGFSNANKLLKCTYTCGKVCHIKYDDLGIQEPLVAAWCDKQTRNKTIGLQLVSGRVDYIPYDQPLHIVGDPDYTAQKDIEHAILAIKQRMKAKKISPSRLAQKLHASMPQVHRALDPEKAGKNLHQLYKMAHCVGLNLQLQSQLDVAS